MNAKKIILIILFLLILIALPATIFLVKQRQDIRQRAAPATSLYLDPSSRSATVNDTLTFDIKVDSGTNKLAGVTIAINYDAQYLEGVTIEKGDFLQDEDLKSITGGTAMITLRASVASGGIQGQGTLAKLTLKALKTTSSTQVVFDRNETYVAGIKDPGNLLLYPQDATVTITDLTEANPSPSPSPSLSPSPTASPGTPSPTPSASPALVTVITAPVDGSSTTNRRPTIIGKSFNNALVIITIDAAEPISDSFNASSTGNWTYTPVSNLPFGTFEISVAGEDPITQDIEQASITLTITAGSGGAGIASPSPRSSPSASPSPSASVLPSTTPGTGGISASASASSSAIPATGTTFPTYMFLSVAFLLLFFGILSVFF